MQVHLYPPLSVEMCNEFLGWKSPTIQHLEQALTVFHHLAIASTHTFGTETLLNLAPNQRGVTRFLAKIQVNDQDFLLDLRFDLIPSSGSKKFLEESWEKFMVPQFY